MYSPKRNHHHARANETGFWSAVRISLSASTSRQNRNHAKVTHRLNGRLPVVCASGFIFGRLLSLAMQMIGIFVFFMSAFSAPTPPRSPPLIPSTSSITMTAFWPATGWPSNCFFDPDPKKPSSEVLSTADLKPSSSNFFDRVSDAFSSITLYPQRRAAR